MNFLNIYYYFIINYSIFQWINHYFMKNHFMNYDYLMKYKYCFMNYF